MFRSTILKIKYNSNFTIHFNRLDKNKKNHEPDYSDSWDYFIYMLSY